MPEFRIGRQHPIPGEVPLFEVGTPDPCVRVTADQVNRVFLHWITTMRAQGRTARWQPELDDKRERRIREAIRSHGMPTVLAAIDGCARSDFHMGQNKRGQRYDDITLILRDDAYIERFAGMADDDPF